MPAFTMRVNFNNTIRDMNGRHRVGGVPADAAGDDFGTTDDGGAHGAGTVFEIAKTGGGYASTPTTLFSFNGTNGAGPVAGLIADAAGDLFGMIWQMYGAWVRWLASSPSRQRRAMPRDAVAFGLVLACWRHLVANSTAGAFGSISRWRPQNT